MINIAKPFLPPVDEYKKYIDDIWQRNWLTNNGPLVNELELKLTDYLGTDEILFLNNGTIALQIAIKALQLKGEVITTPFSYVATTSSIVWENCIPVMVDIHPTTYNIDASKIEAAITDKTSAILATHVYGNPCDISIIEGIAKRHSLKVIYDAAHCFGTRYKGKSIFSYGDITATSFHTTKIFHTVEGGAVFTSNKDLHTKMAFMRNFGHNGPEFAELGINGKNSELHAAMGLLNLNYIDELLDKRKHLCELYADRLADTGFVQHTITPDTKYNNAYFPILFETEEDLLTAVSQLNDYWVYPRRYFFPSLSTLSYIAKYETPVCDSISRRILCLPLYHELGKSDIDFICRIITRSLKKA